MNEAKFLTRDELKEKAPAIFAKTPNKSVSGRYVFVSTEKLLNDFEKLGWKPVFAKQNKTKNENGESYLQHVVRLRSKEGLLEKGEYVSEIVLRNSHNRSVAVSASIGIYRCTCANQAVVADSEILNFTQKHINIDFEYIQRVVKEAAKKLKHVDEKIKEYQTIELTEVERNKFAYVARNAHWGDTSIVDPKLLLNTRRPEDEKNDLWHVFNTIQENVVKGGLSYTGQNAEGKTRKRKTRMIKNIARDMKINSQLWTIMAAFAINRKF